MGDPYGKVNATVLKPPVIYVQVYWPRPGRDQLGDYYKGCHWVDRGGVYVEVGPIV